MLSPCTPKYRGSRAQIPACEILYHDVWVPGPSGLGVELGSGLSGIQNDQKARKYL